MCCNEFLRLSTWSEYKKKKKKKKQDKNAGRKKNIDSARGWGGTLGGGIAFNIISVIMIIIVILWRN